MRRMTKIIAAIALCFAALTSCRHKELCLHHPHTANVRIDVDWSGFEKEVPTGMTVLVYDDPRLCEPGGRHISLDRI